MFEDKVESYEKELTQNYYYKIDAITSKVEELKSKRVKLVLINLHLIETEFGNHNHFVNDVQQKLSERDCDVCNTYDLGHNTLAKIIVQDEDKMVQEIKVGY